MSEKFKGKYRSESARLQNWNYGSNAACFITICTKDREHYFGEIQGGKMLVSPAGAIAYVLWFEIKNHAKNIELGEFVVMPNHHPPANNGSKIRGKIPFHPLWVPANRP